MVVFAFAVALALLAILGTLVRIRDVLVRIEKRLDAFEVEAEAPAAESIENSLAAALKTETKERKGGSQRMGIKRG